MRVTYFQTIKRDYENSLTTFNVTLNEPCDYAEHGILLCVGKISLYTKGVPLEIEGEYDNNQSLLNVHKCKISTNREEDAYHLIKTISSEITDAKALQIAKICGGNIFKITDDEKTREEIIKILDKINQKKKIVNKFFILIEELKKKENLSNFLLSIGVPIDKILLLSNAKVNKEDFINNPYRFCSMALIPISQADMIAKKIKNVEPYSEIRLIGFVSDAIKSIKQDGFTSIELKDLCNLTNKKLKKEGLFPECQINLAILNWALSELSSFASIHEIGDKEFIYNNEVWEKECQIIDNIKRLNLSKKPICSYINIKEIEDELGFSYNNGQKNAFNLLKKSGIKVLTGPPGSGKTAIIKGLIKCFENNGKESIKLSATTGRASQIISDSCGQYAQTVHKMLEIRPGDFEHATFNSKNQIDADLIIVDEISMIDLNMFAALIDAVKSNSILLLVGDKDQLLSVEYGNVLNDLIESGKIETYYLTEIMRQSGFIPANAKLINQGVSMIYLNSQFELRTFYDEENLLNDMLRDVSKDNCQVIAPTHAGILGIENINKLIQDKVNKENKPVLSYGAYSYRLYDKIILTQTKYSEENSYYNGEMGIITNITPDEIEVNIKGRRLLLTHSDFMNMSLAYAITIHKSQGGEEDTVHIVLSKKAKSLLTRRLLYTAVTRAKKKVIIYSHEDAFNQCVGNVNECKRDTLLAKRLSMEL